MELQSLNEMDPSGFVQALGGIFEDSPWVAQAVEGERPFSSLDDLHGAMVWAVDRAGPDAQLALVRAHPDLGAWVRMSDASVGEQAGAGLDRLSSESYARFQSLNTAYRTRFGFPFIIAVKGHTPDSILSAFESRLENGPDAELTTALAQVAQIARFRLEGVIQ